MLETLWDRIWVRLGIGFGLLLLLIAASTWSTFRETFRNFDQLFKAYEEHYRIADALTRIRSNIYLAGIFKRDFLLDPSRSNGPRYGQQFTEIQASTDQNLRALETLLSSEQAPSLAQLRAELESYMRPLAQALDWERPVTADLRWQLLRAQLRQREAALDMAADVEAINTKNLAIQQSQIRQAQARFRRFLLLVTCVSLLFGVLIAGFTVWHMRRLERQSEQAKLELRELSHELVKVQEDERKTISRELHDEVGQMLTGLRMELAGLDVPHARQDPAFYQRLLETKALTEQTLRTVRNLAMVLRPSMLDDLGLAPALRWQAKEFERHSGLAVELSITGDVDQLADDLRTCLYRVVQEALTNAGRHARATNIKVTIDRSGDSVRAVIEDDGIGFDRARIKHRGLGLVGIEERVRELGGEVEIQSEAGSGTRIVIQLAIPQRFHEHSSVAGG